MEVDSETSWSSLGALWKSVGGRFEALSELSGGLVEVDLGSLGRCLGGLWEVNWKSSWQCIVRSGAADVSAFRSVVESL